MLSRRYKKPAPEGRFLSLFVVFFIAILDGLVKIIPERKRVALKGRNEKFRKIAPRALATAAAAGFLCAAAAKRFFSTRVRLLCEK